jgi:hypothetical protein
VAIQRVVVESDLRVERVDLALFGEDERIDLGQRRVRYQQALVSAVMAATAALTLAAGMPIPNASLRA